MKLRRIGRFCVDYLGHPQLLDRWKEASQSHLPGIPRDELLEYMREAAKGIDFLNSNQRLPGGEQVGIQHKDIKPQNLLLVGGTVKVADFGLAKVLYSTVTTASSTMTPAYAAPEFFSGQATRWSDQYSLAVTYCQLAAGRLPFEGSPLEVMAGHVTRAPHLKMLPEEDRPVVARALAKKPEDRWPTCRDFVIHLERGASPTPVPSTTASISPVTEPPAAPPPIYSTLAPEMGRPEAPPQGDVAPGAAAVAATLRQPRRFRTFALFEPRCVAACDWLAPLRRTTGAARPRH
ncbi:MAG: protein kinase [Gemmataceae bacterium]